MLIKPELSPNIDRILLPCKHQSGKNFRRAWPWRLGIERKLQLFVSNQKQESRSAQGVVAVRATGGDAHV